MGKATKLTSFLVNAKEAPVQFVETAQVKPGVSCDIYKFLDNDARDLGIVTVQPGNKTPLQRIVLGVKTLEGYISGEGALTVRSLSGDIKTYHFPTTTLNEVEVQIGEVMQWQAAKNSTVVFYEICEPPYEDGRFENLAE